MYTCQMNNMQENLQNSLQMRNKTLHAPSWRSFAENSADVGFLLLSFQTRSCHIHHPLETLSHAYIVTTH